MTIKSYSELRRILSFEDRYAYLRLRGSVGRETFGFDRVFNQKFYTSQEWKQTRNFVIVRDNGCDLGVDGREIHDRILIHHMNPMTIDDLKEGRDWIIDPEYLITTTHLTHNAIHYGDESLLLTLPPPRRPNDTVPWRKTNDVKS